MKKRSAILSVGLFLGICYLWPWAIRQKSLRLEAEARAKDKLEKMEKIPSAKVEVVSTSAKTSIPVKLRFPVRGKDIVNIISFFGDPRAGGSRSHEGVDIQAPRGTPVIAVADGTVESVKENGSGGRQIWLLLDNGWKVYYAHLHAQLVKEGVSVKAGDIIGTVGNTGNAQNAGPHLHFCLYPVEKKAVDPILYLPGQLSLP